jgi:bacterial/archaeal transporter family protein
MQRWIVYAFLSTLFAGATAVVARLGLNGISAELGLAVRTAFVFVMVSGFCATVVPRTQFSALTQVNIAWLAVSALMTSLSWIFYYKAIQIGEVSIVALIDKGSVIIALLLAFIVLGEPLTVHKCAGAALMIAGLLVIARSA